MKKKKRVLIELTAQEQAQIYDARKRAGWRQRDLARKARVTDRTISRIENQPGVAPQEATIWRIREALGIKQRSES